MPKSEDDVPMDDAKGESLRFVAGKYAGKRGWLDTSKEMGENTIPVIVDLGKKGLKKTYVYVTSARKEPTGPPKSYADAVLQQCPDLDKALTCFCRAFVKTGIEQDIDEFLKIIVGRLSEEARLLEEKGSKALYRRIKLP